MKNIPLLSAVVLLAVIGFLFFTRDKAPDPVAEASPESAPEEVVQEENSDPQDLGKHCVLGEKTEHGSGVYYQGREIALVVGHSEIKWLERANREAEESPTIALELIDLEPGQILADIGAGSGYYSFRLAMKFPESTILSVDIQQEMLTFLENRKAQLGVENIETHLGTIEGVNIAPESIDAALMVDAYHEFSHPYEMAKSIFDALRPGGRVYLLEYRAEDPNVPIKPLHKMTQDQAKKEMAVAGFEWEATRDELPWQHFMIFRKP